MPKFLNRMTISDFKKELQTYSLQRLVELNQSYIDEFENISIREDNAQEELKKLNNQLLHCQQQLVELKARSATIEEEEEQWQKLNQPVNCSRTERYLHRNSFIGSSPVQSHNSFLLACTEQISLFTALIEKVESRIKTIDAAKRLSMQEIGIINMYIDVMRKAAAPLAETSMTPSQTW